MHSIEFLKKANNDVVSPKVESAVGPAPPEGCGGTIGYAELLEAYNNPDSPGT